MKKIHRTKSISQVALWRLWIPSERRYLDSLRYGPLSPLRPRSVRAGAVAPPHPLVPLNTDETDLAHCSVPVRWLPRFRLCFGCVVAEGAISCGPHTTDVGGLRVRQQKRRGGFGGRSEASPLIASPLIVAEKKFVLRPTNIGVRTRQHGWPSGAQEQVVPL